MSGAEYLDKSPDAARMGKAAEYLDASSAILATRGKLNVSTALVDDDGVDLVFHRRGHTATLSVQIKARMSDGTLVRSGRVQANAQEATFRARLDLDMLFVVVNPVGGRVTVAWLVPGPEFAALVPAPNGRGCRVFAASLKPEAADRWRPGGWRLPSWRRGCWTDSPSWTGPRGERHARHHGLRRPTRVAPRPGHPALG